VVREILLPTAYVHLRIRAKDKQEDPGAGKTLQNPRDFAPYGLRCVAALFCRLFAGGSGTKTSRILSMVESIARLDELSLSGQAC
jgi:hypothetical protein